MQELRVFLLQRSFFCYIICRGPRNITQTPCLWPLDVDHVLFRTLYFHSLHPSHGHSQRAEQCNGDVLPKKQEISPIHQKRRRGNGEIQFVFFVFLLSGNLSIGQVISLGLNSMYHFSIIFSSCSELVSPHVREHNCVISAGCGYNMDNLFGYLTHVRKYSSPFT